MADKVFDALADVHRRRLLVALLDHNPQDISDLSGVPWNIEETEVEMAQKYHVHLPKLADYGFIDWHPDDEVAVKGPQFDEIKPVLELLDEHRDELPDGWL
ncbi:helix-turn-helix domain-containing protein [Halosolutus halophilus]|uniref:helix-turn-helix domain-containing protein n=1 Tax=Halosolutus halophilus TaxID=1552990 RepID=UPI0022350ACD|nr:helix-turn-helix domain-containing protein [Halosolutus halophilus]